MEKYFTCNHLILSRQKTIHRLEQISFTIQEHLKPGSDYNTSEKILTQK